MPDWKLHVQPEGQPYFQNTSTQRRFKFLTGADLSCDIVLDEVNLFASEFERVVTLEWFPDLPLSEIEVVLLPTEDRWLYYMVDLERRCVFWAHPLQFRASTRHHLRYIEEFSKYVTCTTSLRFTQRHTQVIYSIMSSGNTLNTFPVIGEFSPAS